MRYLDSRGVYHTVKVTGRVEEWNIIEFEDGQIGRALDKHLYLDLEREEKCDALINAIAEGIEYSYEEMDYIYRQLGELKRRGHF